MGARILICGICGGIFGLVTGLTVAKFAAFGLDYTTPADAWISGSIANMFRLIIVPAAVVGGAVSFILFAAVGVLRISAGLGAAGGALFGLFIGPPDFMLAGFYMVDVFVELIWEWIMAGATGLIGHFIEKSTGRFE